MAEIDYRLSSVYTYFIAVFTDESNDPKNGLTGFAFTIPELKISNKESISDHLTVFTVELLASLMVLQWVELIKIVKVMICSDSLSSLTILYSLYHLITDLILFMKYMKCSDFSI